VFRLIAARLTDGRMKGNESQVESHREDRGVDSSPCAIYNAVGNVLRCADTPSFTVPISLAALLVVEDNLRGRFPRFELCTQLLDLRCLPFL
jgi:hypothetical protein